MIIKNRLQENIPLIRCTTCGKIAKQSSVIELESFGLNREKRKTWNKIIKSSFNVSFSDSGKLKRNKRLFYASMLQNCINKKHKLKVIHLNNIKFHKSFLDTVNIDKGED